MARANTISIKAFCDDLYTELAGMRMRMLAINDEMTLNYGDDIEQIQQFQRHLLELADQIEWKLQILSHVCPYDWKGSMEKVETGASVQQVELKGGPDCSPGYVGG